MRTAEKITIGIILSVLIFYSHFYKLNSLPYRIWDETRLATSAYEMAQTGNLLVPTIDSQPDMWYTKPPLMIWAQALFIKCFGLNELSIRLPAAFSAMLTIMIVFYFVLYFTKSGWAALISSIVLCTANGYLADHSTRFGEYDAMLALFTTAALLSFFMYTETAPGKIKNRFLLIFFVTLTLGILTKAISILIFAPALFVYLIFRRQLFDTLRNKTFYIGIAIVIIFGIGYYFLREHFNPGYIKTVYENELGGRYLTVLEGHSGPFRYYYDYLRVIRFDYWFWTIPIGFVLLFFNPDKKLLRVSLYCYTCVVIYLLILSSAQTKLFWYDLPVYPLLAIIIAVLMLQVSFIANRLIPALPEKAALIIFMIIFSIQPLYNASKIVGRAEFTDETGFYAPSYSLRQQAQEHSSNLKDAIYIDHDYTGRCRILYIYELNALGMNIEIVRTDDSIRLKAGDKVIIINDKGMQNTIECDYNFSLVEQTGDMRFYKLLSRKSAI